MLSYRVQPQGGDKHQFINSHFLEGQEKSVASQKPVHASHAHVQTSGQTFLNEQFNPGCNSTAGL